MKKFGIIALALFCFSGLMAQNKKALKEGSISYKTEWQIDYKDGAENKYKDSEYKYDQDGNVLMEKTYDEKGTILTHFEYQYDSNGNQIVQITYNAKDKVVKREEFKYEGKLKVEKKVIGPDGKVKSKKIYEYKTF
jgi:hypothetical protein